VRSLTAVFALGVLSAQTSLTTWDGVFTKEQAERGSALYTQNCSACHGAELMGGELAPPLAGIPFFSNWEGLTVGDLFERIRVSMPADRPGRVSREQNVDIVAYILRVNQFPAGKVELGRQTEMMKQIQLVMYKPEGKK